jgi:TRAP-type C4-dicarboxylate transport system permease small subunit
MPALLLARLRRAAELFSAALFAAMFFAFLLQVISRYVFNAPLSWTLEVCSISYIWIVFFAGATIVKPQQHITFDMLYGALAPGWQRVFALFTTGSIVVLFAVCLPGTIGYVLFVSRKATLILDIRLDVVYSCFLIFMVGVLVYSVARLRMLLSRRWGDSL